MPDLLLRLTDEANDEPHTPVPPLATADALALLTNGEITAAQLVPWGSNYTFGVALTTASGREHLGIYKPRDGEAPLWDFPSGTLFKREHAAFLLSERLGWSVVPPTVVRDGPHGVGSVQLYIEPGTELIGDPAEFWFRCDPAIERIVLFDHIANNADRKIGHCMVDVTGKVWGIDHGLTFNREPKLRTVLWQYIGMPVADELLADLVRLAEAETEVRAELGHWLKRAELDALYRRIQQFIETPVYPGMPDHRSVPYGWY
ncbi:MAG TPA: SCO1664 family protein [Thermomicrobiales bacterium]|nr:SCO1664 family protein [Thermomicrobiales bacterium]